MKFRFLNGNIIKIIAAVAMVIDHTGLLLFPDILAFRMIGRISMPLFAFAIAEGCRYTRDKFRYFSLIFVYSLAAAAVYDFLYGGLYLSIFTTFSLSILLIYALQNWKRSIFENEGALAIALSGALFLFLVVFVYFLNRINAIGGVPFSIDYGFWGCMLPVFASACDLRGCTDLRLKLPDRYYVRLAFFACGVALLCLNSPLPYSYFALLSLVFLVFYNEKRGKYRLKYFFYVFYPVHMAILYLIWLLI